MATCARTEDNQPLWRPSQSSNQPVWRPSWPASHPASQCGGPASHPASPCGGPDNHPASQCGGLASHPTSPCGGPARHQVSLCGGPASSSASPCGGPTCHPASHCGGQTGRHIVQASSLPRSGAGTLFDCSLVRHRRARLQKRAKLPPQPAYPTWSTLPQAPDGRERGLGWIEGLRWDGQSWGREDLD